MHEFPFAISCVNALVIMIVCIDPLLKVFFFVKVNDQEFK